MVGVRPGCCIMEYFAIIMVLLGPFIAEGCLEYSVVDNQASIHSNEYPLAQYATNCHCSLVAANDLDLNFIGLFEQEGTKSEPCEVQLSQYKNYGMLLFCPLKDSHKASFAVKKGENITWALNNENNKQVKLKVELTAQEGGEFSLMCAEGLPDLAGWVEYDGKYSVGGVKDLKNEAITGAMVGVIVIIVVIILVLIVALVKMNIDKARVRKQKERIAESTANSQNNLDNGGKPSMNPKGNDGFVNSAYSMQSVDPSTRGSTPVGFADLGGPAMKGSLPASAKASTVSIGSFMAGNPSYGGSRTSLNNSAHPHPEAVNPYPDNGRSGYNRQPPPQMTSQANPHVPRPQATTANPEPYQGYQPQAKPESNRGYQPQAKPEPYQGYQPQAKPEPYQGYQPQAKPKSNRDYQPQAKPEPYQGYQPQAKAESKRGYQPQAKPEPYQPQAKSEPSQAYQPPSYPYQPQQTRTPQISQSPGGNIPASATPLTNIPVQRAPEAMHPYNRGLSHAHSIDSDAESARYTTAPTSPIESPVYRSNEKAETAI